MNNSATQNPFASLSLALVGASPFPASCNAQLLPDGEFAARDGRPASTTKGKLKAWRLDAASAAALCQAAQERQTPLAVDYDHQTLAAQEKEGQAPASGWIEALHYEPGRGLFAKVEWTARAKAYIAAGEYRYISPVFQFNPSTGAVTSLLCVALTNLPALDGMEAVALRQAFAAQNQQEKQGMDEAQLEALRKALGLEATADEKAVLSALDGITGKGKAGEKPDANGTDAKPAAAGSAPDAAALTMLTAQAQQIAALRAEVATLKNSKEESALEQTITAALADGRLPKGLEDWARGLAKTDAAALSTLLTTLKPITALTQMQTDGANIPDTANKGLSPEEKWAAAMLDLPETAFKGAGK